MASKKQPTQPTAPAPTVDEDLAAVLAAIEAAASNPNAQAATGYQSSYYGVPQGYKRKDKQTAGIYYMDGRLAQEGYYDLNNTPFDLLYNQLDDIGRQDLRDTLFAKGYYDTNERPTSGRITKDDEDAVTKLLLESNWTQTEWRDLLGQVKARPDQAPTGGGTRRYTLTSPDDLKVVANRVAIETLGRRLDPDDLNGFVQLYQRKQLKYQQQAQRAGGGVTVEPADPTTVVMNQLQQKYAGEAEAMGYIKAVDRLARLVGAY